MVIKRGEPILASDFARLTFLPKGTVLMYDAAGWQDDSAVLPGWYKCDGGSTPYGNTPDMRGRFIRAVASTPSTPAGGNHYRTYTIPPHSHAVSGTLDTRAVSHYHYFNVAMLPAGGKNWTTSSKDTFDGDYALAPDASARRTLTISRISATTHTHTFTPTVGSYGSSTTIDTRPDFYRVIYIIKMV